MTKLLRKLIAFLYDRYVKYSGRGEAFLAGYNEGHEVGFNRCYALYGKEQKYGLQINQHTISGPVDKIQWLNELIQTGQISITPTEYSNIASGCPQSYSQQQDIQGQAPYAQDATQGNLAGNSAILAQGFKEGSDND
jgi:hypothetical protein